MIAATPEQDLLSELLKDVRLSGSVFLNGRFSEPFAVISPARWSDDQPTAQLRHASVFHLVAEGGCRLEMPDGEERDLVAGDLVLIPFTPEHRFWRGDHGPFVEADDVARPGPAPGVHVINIGGGGPVTRLICGFIESAELMPAPFFRSLPPLLVEPTSGDTVSATLAASAAALVTQLDGEPQPGIEAVLGRLMELLFLEVLRRQAQRQPDGRGGVLAASRDPILSRAVAALHREPARRWSVEDLAKAARTSRTVLNERFSAVLGKSPMDYLAGWRMQLACDLLRATRKPLPQIAEEVGYDSAAAFSRAFRRITGETPGAWRAGG
jgi:AraC-like DNA-binding protein